MRQTNLQLVYVYCFRKRRKEEIVEGKGKYQHNNSYDHSFLSQGEHGAPAIMLLSISADLEHSNKNFCLTR